MRLRNLLIAAILPFSLQAQTPFPVTETVYVIAFKNGTNCTANPYNIYRIDTNGVFLTGSLATTTTTKELNAFGVNSDGFLYGMNYDRVNAGSTCTFNNKHLYRYGASGTPLNLGVVRDPPSGQAVGTAVGLVVPNNRYVFFAGPSSALEIGFVNHIDTLSGRTDTLTPQYFPVTNNCPGKLYADFALNPADGNLYTYATYSNGSGYEGTVLKLDLSTQTITCTGSPAAGVFTSANDNFGGIMFGANGFLYGVNINTRKFYKINVSSGAITLITTFAGSGNMRADLGSNIIGTAPVALALHLASFAGIAERSNDKLNWETTEDPYAAFEIQSSSDAKTFTTAGEIRGSAYDSEQGDRRNYSWLGAAGNDKFYRLRMTDIAGHLTYSSTVAVSRSAESGTATLVYPSPASSRLTVVIPEDGPASVTIRNVQGTAVLYSALNSSRTDVDVSGLPPGWYTAVIEVNGSKQVQKVSILR